MAFDVSHDEGQCYNQQCWFCYESLFDEWKGQKLQLHSHFLIVGEKLVCKCKRVKLSNSFIGQKMPGSSGKTKRKIRWSKLYSFACLRPVTAEHDPSQQLLGQPGFSRVVFCNEPLQHKAKPYKYPKNYVSTTKYNVVTFLPKALFEQFRRVANLYFLLAAALSITSLAPFTPTSLIAPLVFVVGVSMIKEAVEDWHRFLQVKQTNF